MYNPHKHITRDYDATRWPLYSWHSWHCFCEPNYPERYYDKSRTTFNQLAKLFFSGGKAPDPEAIIRIWGYNGKRQNEHEGKGGYK